MDEEGGNEIGDTHLHSADSDIGRTRNIMQFLSYANSNPPRDKQFTSTNHRAGSGPRVPP